MQMVQLGRRAGIVFCGCLVAAVLVPGGPVHADTPAGTTRVDIGPDGTSGSGGESPSLSADGRFVAFQSGASLVPDDHNDRADIYVHDRASGETRRVSVDSSGGEGNGGASDPSISADGRFVAFQSWASDLVPGDTNRWADIFVHDRETGLTQRVSVGESGEQAVSGSTDPSLSADGRYVVFESHADNLVPEDTNRIHDAFVHDRQTGTTERVSVNSQGRQGTGMVWQSSISGDGRYVAFVTASANMATPHADTNQAADVFVRDRQLGTTRRVSTNHNNDEVPQGSLFAQISADGRHVAFESHGNLVPQDTGRRTTDVYVRDLVNDRLTWVSREDLPRWTDQGSTSASRPAISADGRYVAFSSGQRWLMPSDSNPWRDVYVRDLQTGAIERANVGSDGVQGDGQADTPAMSADGRFVAFRTSAVDLQPGWPNGWHSGVYVRDRGN